MRFTLRAFVAVLALALSLLVVGAAGASSGNGDGNLVPCEVDLAGLGTAVGVGQSNGNNFTCHASLDQDPPTTERINGDTCDVLVTASGRVNMKCH